MCVSEIKELIESRGIKYIWLAKKLNISTAYLSLIMHKKRTLPTGFVDSVVGLIGGNGGIERVPPK